MFEKEAGEYATENYSEEVGATARNGFKDGAEYGYNKAKKEDKWHYVKDGDLPTDEEWKWCVSRSGLPYVAKYEELFVSWRNQEYKDVLCPYAWKEIVLPKEIKNE